MLPLTYCFWYFQTIFLQGHMSLQENGLKVTQTVGQGQVYCILKYRTAGNNSFKVMAKTTRGHMSLRVNGLKVTQTVGQGQVYCVLKYHTAGFNSFQAMVKKPQGHMSLWENGLKVTQTVGQGQVYSILKYHTEGSNFFQVIAKNPMGTYVPVRKWLESQTNSRSGAGLICTKVSYNRA